MKSVGCFIESQDDDYLLYNPYLEGLLVTKEDIELLEGEIKDYLLFRLDKIYKKYKVL
jgi:hypothetical protein